MTPTLNRQVTERMDNAEWQPSADTPTARWVLAHIEVLREVVHKKAPNAKRLDLSFLVSHPGTMMVNIGPGEDDTKSVEVTYVLRHNSKLRSSLFTLPGYEVNRIIHLSIDCHMPGAPAPDAPAYDSKLYAETWPQPISSLTIRYKDNRRILPVIRDLVRYGLLQRLEKLEMEYRPDTVAFDTRDIIDVMKALRQTALTSFRLKIDETQSTQISERMPASGIPSLVAAIDKYAPNLQQVDLGVYDDYNVKFNSALPEAGSPATKLKALHLEFGSLPGRPPLNLLAHCAALCAPTGIFTVSESLSRAQKSEISRAWLRKHGADRPEPVPAIRTLKDNQWDGPYLEGTRMTFPLIRYVPRLALLMDVHLLHHSSRN